MWPDTYNARYAFQTVLFKFCKPVCRGIVHQINQLLECTCPPPVPSLDLNDSQFFRNDGMVNVFFFQATITMTSMVFQWFCFCCILWLNHHWMLLRQCLHKWNLDLRTWCQKLFNGEKKDFWVKKRTKKGPVIELLRTFSRYFHNNAKKRTFV